MNVHVGPDAIQISVRNEGVTHECVLVPDEAIHFGVMLIQLSAQAKAMGHQQRVQMNGNQPQNVIPFLKKQ